MQVVVENSSWATALNVLAIRWLFIKIEQTLIATQQPSIASIWATGMMIKQKSADGIVAKCPS
jgi:hypothetical protein